MSCERPVALCAPVLPSDFRVLSTLTFVLQNKIGSVELDVCMLTQGYWPTQSVPPCM